MEYKITIIYGEEGQLEKQYSFKTMAELDAFLLGVDDTVGWMEYGIKEGEV